MVKIIVLITYKIVNIWNCKGRKCQKNKVSGLRIISFSPCTLVVSVYKLLLGVILSFQSQKLVNENFN